MWTTTSSPVGVLDVIGRDVARATNFGGGVIPDFSSSGSLWAFSDYSGSHGKYTCYSYLFTADGRLGNWPEDRLQIREKYRLGRRRISYKKLTDSRKRDALPDLLASAADIEGVLFNIVVRTSIRSLFDNSGKVDFEDWGLQSWNHWPVRQFERLLRITHFYSFLAASLSAPGQQLNWITDQDEFVANDQRKAEVVSQTSHLLDRYLSHKVRDFRFGTTADDLDDLPLEDLAAIPDLAAGSLAELFSAFGDANINIGSGLSVSAPEGLKTKVSHLLTWLSGSNRRLACEIFVVDPIKDSVQLNVSRQTISQRPLIYRP